MAIGTGSASIISSGINLVGDYFFGKSARDAAADAAKAQSRLLDLQAQEQTLKNKALSMSIDEQNALLPYAVSLPSQKTIKTTSPGAQPEGIGAAITTAVQSLSGGSGGILLLGALGLGLFLLYRVNR